MGVGRRVVFLVPRRADGGRRDEIWSWMRRHWLPRHHPAWSVCEGTDDGRVFSMAKARNNAARAASDWDVAVIIDSDTIAEPDAIRQAVEMAQQTNKMVVAGDVRMRMDKTSTDRILNGGLWFPRPEGKHPKTGVLPDTIYGEPSSGVIAISRGLWDATGGYVENMKGWGWEDLVFITQCFVAGDGIAWVPDSILLHLYHDRPALTHDTNRNKMMHTEFHHISCRDKEKAKEYLRARGHRW